MKKIRRALVLPALILCTIVLVRRLLIRAIVGRPTELVADDDSATQAADMGGWIINTTAGAAVNSSPHVVPPDAAAALEDGDSSNRTTLTATHQDEDDLLLHSATSNNDTSSSLGYGNYSLRGGATINGKIETYASHRLRGAAATTRHHHNSSSLLIRHANETDAAEASAPSSPSLRGSYDSSPLPAPILGRRNTIISSSLPLHHQRSSGLRSNKNLLVVNPPTPLPTPITMLSQHTGGPVHIIHRETDTVSTTPAPSPSSIPQQVAVHGPVHIIHHVTTTTTEEPPSMEQLENRVLPIDCEGCYPIIDIDGDTAVMFIQKEAQIHFLSYTTQEKTQQQQQQRLKQQKQQSEAQEKFQITTTLNVDFEASAVSISGNIAVVGSSDEGKVYIFEKDTSSSSAEDSWKQVFELSVTNVSYFGSDVSVDNDVLVVGATGDALVDDSGTGATYVYRRDASSPVWIQEAKLVANDNKASYEVYGHVASVKGNFIVTGDEYYDNSNRLYRAVHVYEYDSLTASWTLVADSIANDDCELGIFGTAVEVTDIGNVLISCQRDIHGHTGAVFYYTRSSSSDSVQYVMQQKIIPSDGSAGDEFGGLYKTIAVDGNMLSIGTGKKNRIYTFTLEEESNLWTETSKLDPPAGLDIINFGSNLSLSGNRVLARSSSNVYSYTLP